MRTAFNRPSLICNYSLEISGRQTSISLEPAFYAELRAIAAARQISIGKLLGQLDGANNLASAARVYVLKFYQDKIDAAHQPVSD